MKKFVVAAALVVLFAASASAEVIGTLSRSGTSLNEAVKSGVEFRTSDAFVRSLLAHVFDANFKPQESTIRFYDSFAMMQLALSKGEIQAISAPEAVGEYVLRQNPDYTLRGFMIGKMAIAMAFGFLEERAELCKSFSKAIEDMEEEGKIGLLARDYISGPAAIMGNPPAVKFEEFADAPNITVAVTGDMPPIDYVGADGEPAGFNTAILAEIGRRLHVNIKTITVETGARAAALKSGRADVVFWFMVFRGYDAKQDDVPEGVITSTPYYGWNKSVMLGRK